ncbi:hypothetical protein [uncultured Phascolarctobacterium sp.]|uniref:hypothetical protein n=1 Tax=uncultured Phascolarctobacterium sp. TaxID=512296 RepID=UPI0025ED236D|nr:hypothetical protein [uncultured Phascolarctobacterium sp.]
MILKSIVIKNGLFEKRVNFSDKTNLIFSKKNSCGKTTFIRAILYALGYSVPSTKGVNFKRMEFELTVESNDTEYKLVRRNDYMSVVNDTDESGYTLPVDLYDIQALLTGNHNRDILDSILGAFYVDQEKGWTLLNRGKAIGSIHFSIDQLILGIADRDASVIINKIKKINRELIKYQYMYSVSEYQEEINDFIGNVAYDTFDEKIEKELMLLKMQRYNLNNSIKQIKMVIRKNKQLLDLIDEMKLMVELEDGRKILVTRKNLASYEDNDAFLSAKRKILEGDLAECDKKIFDLESQKRDEGKLFDTETLIEQFDDKIKKININAISVENIIKGLKADRKKARTELENLAKNNNKAVSDLYKYIKKYATEFGLDEKYYSDIFTDDLKSLSGAILHKLVFAFKLAYIRVITDKIGVPLPIILDSPSGREVKQSTVELMLNVLQRDFSDHQVIIASIVNFDFKNKNVIEFKERMFN